MRRISHEKKQEVIKVFKEIGIRQEVARRTGVSCGAVTRALNEYGISYTNCQQQSCRKYELKEDSFESIDTPEKAYWLGFIAADGCIYEKGALSIALAAKDRDVLVSFLKFLGANNPIKSMVIKSSNGITAEYCKIVISSKRMIGDLIRHGLTPRKSLTLKPPMLKENLRRFYILGYFDGDGGISFAKISTRKEMFQSNVSFTGTKEVLLWIASFFDEYGFCSSWVKRHKDAKNNYTLFLSGNSQIVFALRLLYMGTEHFFMKRKYERYVFLSERLMKKKPNGYFVSRKKGKWQFSFKLNKVLYQKSGFD